MSYDSMMTRGVSLCLLIAGSSVLGAGCITRSLTIKSEPPGAAVYLHDQYMGDTPYTLDPVWYGGYRIMLEKPGYQRLYDHREYKAPKKFWIPLDLVMELVPFEVRDDQVWNFKMEEAAFLAEPAPPSRQESNSGSEEVESD